MPKNKGKKNGKSRDNNDTKSHLILADSDGQVYGKVLRALGSAFFEIKCVDGKNRRCKARKKWPKINADDWCIISLRDFDDETGDIIHSYTHEEIGVLRKKCEIPEEENNGKSGNDDCYDFETVEEQFNFEDI